MKSPESFHPALPVFHEVLARCEGRKIWIAGHLRPDGDCIGSQVALTRLLRSLGMDAVAINGHAVPRNLQALLGDTPFVREPVGCNVGSDALITVDCSGRDRIGDTLGKALPQTLFNLDHHLSNPQDAELNWVDAESPATCALLAEILFSGGWEFDATTANALYAGIATDTGQFRFPNTHTRVFSLVASLCEKGANPAAVASLIYEQESMAKHQLLQRFLGSLELFADGRCCIGFLSEADFSETGAHTEDTEGMVDYARSLSGVLIGVYLEAQNGVIKGSLRGRSDAARVDLLAAMFSGGGHACAAGFRFEGSMEDLLGRLKPEILKRLDALS